ncbi:MAG: carboxypeptidase regulatory-like domain-containing protein [Acidobacteriaceae bacterium]|nr:carboxypeptidase regulatory-like domain-containing protein [Acidobacteriaceae bacterium]
MITRLNGLCAALIIGLMSLTSISSAQTTFGSVVGTVTDPSGSAVPNAQVTLTNLGTSEKRTETTNSEGLYQFVNVIPGQYSVEIAQAGFNRLVRSPVTVETQTTSRIDLPLQVGNVSQTVEVTAQTPLLQPETSSLGQVVDQRKTNELPLNGRNPLNLVALVPSVVPQGGSMSNPNGQNPFAWGNYQIGGGMANQSMVWLDGSPVNGSYINITALIPTQDSLQEFKVATNSLPPEYGRFGGGVVNFTTKSGSNDLHGTAYEFLRNRELNANTFFNNLAGVQRGPFTQNQFGVNLGGPVYIPKLYDGRNKTFFFVNYEGFRLRQGQSFTQTVPTAAERTGDLSGYAAANNLTIYDPLTTCGSGAPGSPACTGNQKQYDRLPFAGNQIPTNRINPTSLKLLGLFPLPNAPGNAQGVGNWVGNASVGGNQNETVVHIDQNVSDKQHITARYTYWGNLNLPIDPFHNGVCQDRCTETFNTNNFVLGDTYSFTPTTVWEFRASYQRFSYDRTPSTLGYDLSQLGWPASLNTQVAFRDLPVPVINGFDTAGTFGSQGAGSVIVDRNDNYRIASTLTKIAGKHTWRFGGEFMRMTHNYAQTNTPSGIFYFNSDLTGSNGATPTSGAGLATFLLGYPSSGSASTPAFVAAQQLYPALFLNDDYHATEKLTLNLGVRWEHSGPWTERFDRLTSFNPVRLNPVLLANGLRVPGSFDLVNSDGNSYRSNIYPKWYQFAPRVGLAYQITHKTVFRVAYGVFWLPNDVAWDYSPNNNPINSIGTPYLATVYTGVPAGSISNPFPSGIVQPPGRNPSYQQILLGRGIDAPELGNPYAYAQQWNADIQREFGTGFLIDVAYGASKGTHLPMYGPQIDQLPDQYLSLGNSLFNTVPNPFYGTVTAPGSSLSQPVVQQGQLLRPYPQYTGVGYAGQGIGDSTYNSLQVTAQKRFSGGNSIMVAYTFAKLISNTDTLTGWLESGGTGGYQDNNNLRLEKSLASFDVPNRLVVSYVLDIPVGKGRKYLANANGFVQAALGGWGVQGVTTVQDGFPLHFGVNTNNTGSFGGGIRPNYVLGCNKSISGPIQAKYNHYFNTSCFVAPPSFTFGTEGRNDPTLRSPGMANWDFSAFKSFPLAAENRVNLQFRAEFFNIFNRVQFGYPDQTVGDTAFGVITSQLNNPRLVQFALRLSF